jgi:hypothetical protein
MSDAHKNLTGSDLHEPKGVAAAAINLVYVSNGAGSGTWQKLTASQLTGTGNPWTQLLQVQDEKTSGTAGGTFTQGAWRTRTLNTTKTNEITGASLASNQITLPAGIYEVEASAPAYDAENHVLKLVNITDTADLVMGVGGYHNSNVNGDVGTIQVQTVSYLAGRFTLAGIKVIELQHRASKSGSFGVAHSLGTEIYAQVRIRKVG